MAYVVLARAFGRSARFAGAATGASSNTIGIAFKTSKAKQDIEDEKSWIVNEMSGGSLHLPSFAPAAGAGIQISQPMRGQGAIAS